MMILVGWQTTAKAPQILARTKEPARWDPSMISETIRGPEDVDFGEQAALALVPGSHLSHQRIRARRVSTFMSKDPVNRGQQLKAIGRREASDELQYSIDPVGCTVRMGVEPLAPLFLSTRHERDRAELHHFLSAISVATQIVALQRLEHVIEVLGVRPIRRLEVVEAQALPPAS
jgi:hypothetical protein